jgi:hypothetical protein
MSLFGWCARMMKDWMLLQKPEDVLILGGWVEQLEAAQARSPALTWESGVRQRNTSLSDELGVTLYGRLPVRQLRSMWTSRCA